MSHRGDGTLPLVCPSCRKRNVVNIDRLLRDKGSKCLHCGVFTKALPEFLRALAPSATKE